MQEAGWTFNLSLCTLLKPERDGTQLKLGVNLLANQVKSIWTKFMRVHNTSDSTEHAHSPESGSQSNLPVTRSRTSTQPSLPVSLKFDTPDLSYVKLALAEADEVFGGNLVRELSEQASNDLLKRPEYFVPRLFIKENAPDRQTSSICYFRLLYPLSENAHKGEGFVEKSIGSALMRVFDNHPEDGPWRLISNTEVKLPNDLSMSTAGARPDLCSQSKIEALENTIPYAISFVAEAKKTSDQEYHAIPQMAFPLHSTLIMFIMMHYRKNGWHYDRRLSRADSKQPLAENSFIFSIFYAQNELSVYVNFPYLKELGRRERNQQYKWALACEKLAFHKLHPDLKPSDRIKLFMTVIAAKHHAEYLEQNIFVVDDKEYKFFVDLLK